MLIFHDPQCADYGSAMRPEQPARLMRSAAHLHRLHPNWEQRLPPPASCVADAILLRAHTAAHLRRLSQPRDFDDDTPFFPDIATHARRATSAALAATEHAFTHHTPAFALMRPPGHHATADTAMGFCYLNAVAVAALYAHSQLGARRVAIWDFDAHHGNGTEAILRAQLGSDPTGYFFASVHQSPCYPGTGLVDQCSTLRNWPLPPRAPRAQHLAALRASLDAIITYQPDLILVSAGFDAFVGDPITTMTLEIEDFAQLGTWLGETFRVHAIPSAGVLEGGYSFDLPVLIETFLAAWSTAHASSLAPVPY
ncbi:MAG: histone deacetylase [Opitutaceae bacterium]|jgi:acetoin utilization deacetylase AcuC-like enzyme